MHVSMRNPQTAPHQPARGAATPAYGIPRAGVTRRQMLYLGFAAAVILSGAIGVAAVHIPLSLIAGALAGIIFVTVVLARPFLGLLIYTSLFWIRPAELHPGLAPLHLERVVGVVALTGLLLARHRSAGHITLDDTRPTRLLWLFLGAALLSVPFAYWRGGALEGVIELAKIVVLYLLVVHLLDNRTRMRIFVGLLCALAIYTAATSLGAYVRGQFVYAQGIERAVGETETSNNPNALATTLAATFPFLLLLGFHKPLRWVRGLCLSAALLLVTTTALTGSRASLLGFLGGCGFLWWISKRRFLAGLLGFALLVTGFLILPGQYRERYATIASSELDESSQGRIDAWKAGVAMVADRPILGVGIGCFSTAHAMGYSPEGRQRWLQPHSLYVQVPAELGLVGAVLFFGFLFESLRLNRRAAGALMAPDGRWRFEKLVLDALFAGFVVLLISGAFGHSLLRRTWYIYAAMGVSILRLHVDQRESSGGADASTSLGPATQHPLEPPLAGDQAR